MNLKYVKTSVMRTFVAAKTKSVEILGDINVGNLFIDHEDDDCIYFAMAFPGVQKTDIDITRNDDMLIVKLPKSFQELECKKFWSHKRLKYIYDFTGYDVDLDKVSSSFVDCILTIKVPKIKVARVYTKIKVK